MANQSEAWPSQSILPGTWHSLVQASDLHHSHVQVGQIRYSMDTRHITAEKATMSGKGGLERSSEGHAAMAPGGQQRSGWRTALSRKCPSR
ncbi:g5098 [Coccomyxa elongata]